MASLTLDLKRDIVTTRRVTVAIGIAFFTLATALGAYVRIPLPGTPVPVTLQTFFVLLSGALLGKRPGFASQALYLALGAAGLPVFQGYSFGIQHLFGPTGGYLAGFLAAGFLVGYLMEKNSFNKYTALAAFVAGNIIIYSFGATWLLYTCRMSLPCAVNAGILPFLPAEIFKTALALMIYSGISRRARQIFVP